MQFSHQTLKLIWNSMNYNEQTKTQINSNSTLTLCQITQSTIHSKRPQPIFEFANKMNTIVDDIIYFMNSLTLTSSTTYHTHKQMGK